MFSIRLNSHLRYFWFRQRTRNPQITAMSDPLHDGHRWCLTDPINYNVACRVSVTVSVMLLDKPLSMLLYFLLVFFLMKSAKEAPISPSDTDVNLALL